MKVFDLHCDTLYKYTLGEYSIKQNNGHIIEQALVKGDYLAQSFAIYIPKDIFLEESFEYFNNQYNLFRKILKDSDVLVSAKTLKDIEKNLKNNKISAVLTVENAELLNRKIERIGYLQECGVKILGLIHNGENCLGFPHTKPNLPLKDFGKEVVKAVNSNDMVIDVSHLNLAGFWDVANLSNKPFIATHSCCCEVFEHSRNLYDDQIKAIANSGGFVGINFYSAFMNKTGKTQIFDIITHLKHLIKVGGEDVAALGTDFDGIDCELFLKTCAEMPLLTDEIIKKFGCRLAEKICFKNAMRIM